jgi:outer membrane protein, heavy metal efflux system
MMRFHRISSCVVSVALACGAPAVGAAQSAATATDQLSLERAVEALVSRNLPVIAARYNVDLFRAQRVAAALKPDPTIVVSATQLTLPRVLTHPSYAGVAVPGNAVLDTQFTVDIERVVERGGKRDIRIAQADIEREIAEAQLANEFRQQTFALKEVFLSALLARANLGVFRDNLRDFDQMRRVFAAQVDEGYTAGVDLRRIGLELVELQGSVSTAQTGYVQGLRDVLNLIGDGDRAALVPSEVVTRTAALSTADSRERDDNDAIDLLVGDLTVAPIDLDVTAVRALALANRPDLRAAQLELDAATAGVRLAEASRTRDVTVGGQYLRSGPDNAVGVSVGVPLTTGRRADAAVAQSTAVRLQAETRVRQVRAQVLTDVEKAFVAYRIGRDRLRLFDGQILRQAAEVRRIEQAAYQEGERGLLSFLDAQRAYNQTLISYNEARHALALSLYQLESATGTDTTRLPRLSSSIAGGSYE